MNVSGLIYVNDGPQGSKFASTCTKCGARHEAGSRTAIRAKENPGQSSWEAYCNPAMNGNTRDCRPGWIVERLSAEPSGRPPSAEQVAKAQPAQSPAPVSPASNGSMATPPTTAPGVMRACPHCGNAIIVTVGTYKA